MTILAACCPRCTYSLYRLVSYWCIVLWMPSTGQYTVLQPCTAPYGLLGSYGAVQAQYSAIMAYLARGVLTCHIRAGGVDSGVTPQITPNTPNHPKRVIWGDLGDLGSSRPYGPEWAYPGPIWPKGAYSGCKWPKSPYPAYMVLQGPKRAESG